MEGDRVESDTSEFTDFGNFELDYAPKSFILLHERVTMNWTTGFKSKDAILRSNLIWQIGKVTIIKIIDMQYFHVCFSNKNGWLHMDVFRNHPSTLHALYSLQIGNITISSISDKLEN
jgi:hypothetical protein